MKHVREVWETFIELGPHAGAHRVALRAGISVFVPLMVLLATGHIAWSAYATFGAFPSLYGRAASFAQRRVMQAAAAFVLVGCVVLGALLAQLAHREWWLVAAGAVLAACVYVASLSMNWHPPGPLFPVFALTVCAMIPTSVGSPSWAFVVATGSALFAILIGQVGWRPGCEMPQKYGWTPVSHLLAEPRIRLQAFRLFLGVGGAGVLGVWAGGAHPYWAMIAAVAGLSGPTRKAQIARGMQRVFGTLAGVLLAGAVLMWHPNGFAAILLIALFQIGAELLVGRNYGLAMLCITPLALTMGQLGHEVALGPLLVDRAIETVLGFVVALAVLFLLPRRRHQGR